jgi:hypothetical protein
MMWAVHVARIGEITKTPKISVGKPVRKRALGRLGVDGSISERILGT